MNHLAPCSVSQEEDSVAPSAHPPRVCPVFWLLVLQEGTEGHHLFGLHMRVNWRAVEGNQGCFFGFRKESWFPTGHGL